MVENSFFSDCTATIVQMGISKRHRHCKRIGFQKKPRVEIEVEEINAEVDFLEYVEVDDVEVDKVETFVCDDEECEFIESTEGEDVNKLLKDVVMNLILWVEERSFFESFHAPTDLAVPQSLKRDGGSRSQIFMQGRMSSSRQASVLWTKSAVDVQ